MGERVGLWIDHKRAFIVTLTPHGEATRLVESGIDKQLGRIHGVRSTAPFESQQVPADDSQERRLKALYNAFYDAVIAHLGNPAAILILGPGEAKGELVKRIEKTLRGTHIVAVETADKLTDRQIVALIQERYREASSADQPSPASS